ncbi:MAG: hypothetical protein PWQ20_72 [Thermotogaceae bacterium]|jgi:hypothetical protein|nr:hypothetical protein [Thermotogaceae bacterium]
MLKEHRFKDYLFIQFESKVHYGERILANVQLLKNYNYDQLIKSPRRSFKWKFTN